jgi:hypothetical protein
VSFSYLLNLKGIFVSKRFSYRSIQKVFVSFDPEGFRIFGIQKVFVYRVQKIFVSLGSIPYQVSITIEVLLLRSTTVSVVGARVCSLSLPRLSFLAAHHMAGRTEGRVVLRPSPAPNHGSWGRHIFIGGASIFVVIIATLFFPAPNLHFQLHNHHGTSHHAHLNLVLVALLCCCIAYSFYRILSRHFRRRQFVEAYIDITPSGVQLGSTYGTTPTYPSSSFNITSPSSQKNPHWHQQNQQRPQPSIYTIKKNKHHHKDNADSDIAQPQHYNHEVVIHAQIPHAQIIDVIVMEIVWPHCVWSQVGFRVRNTVKNTTVNAEVDGETVQSVSACNNHQTENSHDANSQRHPSTTSSSSLSSSSESQSGLAAQRLFQKGEVSIIPAFSPKDCHGMLTYEECLLVQSEIEKLLGT